MRLYLSGAMSSRPHFNYPAFVEAAKKLRAAGHQVFSPAEKDLKHFGKHFFANGNGDERQAAKEFGFDRRVLLAEDLDYICRRAEGIAMIRGWEGSSGARAEHAAALAVGIEFIYL
jgi:uncharacterized protein DUF4406